MLETQCLGMQDSYFLRFKLSSNDSKILMFCSYSFSGIGHDMELSNGALGYFHLDIQVPRWRHTLCMSLAQFWLSYYIV